MERELVTLSNGEVYFWIEQDSSIQLKAITKAGDPVELNADEARELANRLLEMADKIE